MITGQVARHIYETTKMLQQSAIHIQAGMRGMSARRDLRVKKLSNAATVIQVNTCNDIGKESAIV